MSMVTQTSYHIIEREAERQRNNKTHHSSALHIVWEVQDRLEPIGGPHTDEDTNRHRVWSISAQACAPILGRMSNDLMMFFSHSSPVGS